MTKKTQDPDTVNILLIEDSKDDFEFIEKMISQQKTPAFRLVHVDRLGAGLARLLKKDIDVVLLDLTLPDAQGLSGFDKVHKTAPAVPVVILAKLEDEQLAVEAVHRGAQDYLVKHKYEPTKVLSISILYAIERQRIQEELRALSLKDEVTGLYNRRGFVTLSELQLKFSKRHKKGFLLFIFDLDNLKDINDKYGREEGDRALREAASVLNDTFRGSDIISRFAADEFAVIAAEAGLEHAEIIYSRLHFNLKAINEKASHPYTVSLSSGYAVCAPEAETPIDQLIAQAEKKRVLAKKKS